MPSKYIEGSARYVEARTAYRTIKTDGIYPNPTNKTRHDVSFPPTILLANVKTKAKASQYSKMLNAVKAKVKINHPLNASVTIKLVGPSMFKSIFVALMYIVDAANAKISADMDTSPFALGFCAM